MSRRAAAVGGNRSATKMSPTSEDDGQDEGKYHSNSESDDNYSDDHDDNDQNTNESHEKITEAQLLPGDIEKKSILNMFDAMRKDSYFCDVAMISQGVLFRAHRVIISSWSRWLRALLCEAPDEEVVSFDFFDPHAFGAVLDYMYGIPILITVENADSLIKVIRRLELQKLEQQCWRFLMTAIDTDNVEKLHELADRYDCPPLKLAAWRMIQETKPGYSTSPSMAKMLRSKEMQEYVQSILGVTGFTGPGEPGFHTMVTLSKDGAAYAAAAKSANDEQKEGDDDIREEDDDDEIEEQKETNNMPSVFDDVDEEDDDGDNDEDDQSEVASDGEQGIIYRKKGTKRRTLLAERRMSVTDPDQLDASATATEVIKAWASRLKRVYDDCTAEELAAEYEDENDFRIPPNSSNVLMHSHVRQRRSDLLGGSRKKKGGGSVGEDTLTLEEEKKQRMREDMLGPMESPSKSRKGPDGSVRVPPPRSKRPEAPISPVTQLSSYSAESGPGETVQSGPTSSRRKGRNKQPVPLEAFITALDGKKRAINWRQELENFYVSVNMREKVGGIPTILEMWMGKEDQMLSTLVDKYRDIVPSSTLAHIEHILNVMETQTESSFVAASKSGRR